VTVESEFVARCYEDVLPRDIRMVADIFAGRLERGEPPHTALECWFRRVLRRLAVGNGPEQVEPWVVLTAMAFSIAKLGDPRLFAVYAPMPCSPDTFRRAVNAAFRERPDSTNFQTLSRIQ
jgi:hypothetical protein